MDFLFTARFKKAYGKLTKPDRSVTRKKLALMSRNPHHPSLRTKKVQGTENIFECRITLAIRLTWQYEGESILLRVIGEHDDVLKNP